MTGGQPVSIHGLSEAEILEQAERGDLRPQFNPRSVVTWPLESSNGHFDPKVIVPALVNRFFELARPIADAHREPGLNMRISDAGRFFYLIEALTRLGYQGVEGMLLVFLDEFSQLEQRSYDELYLWSIVELSRRNPDHIDTFWPMALTLDMRFRAEPWSRPAEYGLIDHPYRMIELVMYYYVLGTMEREPTDELRFVPRPIEVDLYVRSYRERHGTEPPDPFEFIQRPVMRRRYPSLARCLRRILWTVSDSERDLLMDTLRDMFRNTGRAAFSDARGTLFRILKDSGPR
jgi:hypothetical protein